MGLIQGAQSTLSNPRLQLYCRSGGYLTDLVSGTFKIENIRDPSVNPEEIVAPTAFAELTHKVGTGRYAIITGDTSTWKVGTHRAVCSYVMESGGPTYTQSIEFEVLDSNDWPSGQPYLGYLSTRQVYQEEVVKRKVVRQRLHRFIDEQSRKIDLYTGRSFEPRYARMKSSGQEDSKLLLIQPIIAIEDVYAIWQTTTGEDTYKFEQYLYKVYNRHLDGYAAQSDDRRHPYIELTDVDGNVVKVSNGWAWPYGNQNIEVRGVFGYTEPDVDPNNGRVLIGKTPPDIARAVAAMIARTAENPLLNDPSVWSPGGVRGYRTRDQSVSFGGATGVATFGTSEPTGDPIIDTLLLRYCRPMSFGAV
jgi:hypothetical protein